ncbi:MAG: hypothetical protein ACHQ4J_05985 [Candidatus Binatia bacterium]
MKWVRQIWVLAWVAALGCSADGGPVGTGISSTSASISGDIIDVQTASTTPAPSAAAALPAVRVSIDQVAGLATAVDGAGNFQLSGGFSGTITLRFTTPQFQVTQQLDVPTGAAVVLQDIELAQSGVQAQAVQQFGLRGRVAAIDCNDQAMTVETGQHPSQQFTVLLVAATSIAQDDGQGATCEDIQAGETVAIDGLVQLQTAQTVTALAVTIAPGAPPSEPEPIQQAPFAGSIAGLDCNTGFIVIDDSLHRTRLQLSNMTRIVGPKGGMLTCTDLALGNQVQGQGQLSLDTPGTIDATRIVVTATQPAPALRFFGFVQAVDCTSGTLQLSDITGTISVQLLPTTVITSANQATAQCTDLQLGDRVTGTGQPDATSPEVIDAVQVVFTRSNMFAEHVGRD